MQIIVCLLLIPFRQIPTHMIHENPSGKHMSRAAGLLFLDIGLLT